MFVARHAPRGQAARAQGYLAVAIGVVMAGAMGLAGVLYGAFGAQGLCGDGVSGDRWRRCAAAAHRSGRVAAV